MASQLNFNHHVIGEQGKLIFCQDFHIHTGSGKIEFTEFLSFCSYLFTIDFRLVSLWIRMPVLESCTDFTTEQAIP